jgi:hypothetical protein
VVRGYDALDQLMRTTTFHLIRCDQAPENSKLDITKMLAVNVEPATTFLGSLAWSYGGVKARITTWTHSCPATPEAVTTHSVTWNGIF